MHTPPCTDADHRALLHELFQNQDHAVQQSFLLDMNAALRNKHFHKLFNLFLFLCSKLQVLFSMTELLSISLFSRGFTFQLLTLALLLISTGGPLLMSFLRKLLLFIHLALLLSLCHLIKLGGHDTIEFQILREAIHKRKDDIAIK